MKKSFLALVVFLGLCIACNSEDDTPANSNTNPTSDDTSNDDPVFIDPDGDGVKTEIELIDGTDPEDGCSFTVASIEYEHTTENWRLLDCDEDGVTNGLELDANGDLDIDTNSTNPLDPCSLDIANQVDIPASWLEMNCDDDCFSNGLELEMNTNPLVSNEIGVGLGVLKKVVDYGYGLVTSNYSNNPQRYLGETSNAFGSLSSSYTYDSNANLTRVSWYEAEQGTVAHWNFNYSGSQLISFEDGGYVNFVEYDGNTIRSYYNLSPPGLFSTQIELDPVSGKAIKVEKYDGYNVSYDYYVYNYNYDIAMENLLSLEVSISTYNVNTGEYIFKESYVNTYEYYDSVFNPAVEANTYLIIPSLLVDSAEPSFNIAYNFIGMYGVTAPLVSKKLLKSCNTNYYSGTILVDDCAESNGFPGIVSPYGPSELRVLSYWQ